VGQFREMTKTVDCWGQGGRGVNERSKPMRHHERVGHKEVIISPCKHLGNNGPLFANGSRG